MSGLAGRTIVITGGTGGIGLETAAVLAADGARLILVGRDQARAARAVERIRWAHADAAVTARHADLSSRDEVRRLAAMLDAELDRIDVLVNNAGAIFNRRETTVDGLERTFALNHMGYFLLTALLREKLVRSAPARIVNVASEAHRSVTLDFSDLQNAKRYRGWRAYRRSKLCNILFTRELARRLEGTGVTANCLHPGFVRTGIGDNTSGLFRRGVRLLKRGFAIPVEQGARTPIYAASAPEIAETTGAYFIECKPAEPSAAATDDTAARRLWAESLVLAGLPTTG
jgi:NAD(P)-dependent dehydrogenase (short-subunit alcohol dehydrogenase family)